MPDITCRSVGFVNGSSFLCCSDHLMHPCVIALCSLQPKSLCPKTVLEDVNIRNLSCGPGPGNRASSRTMQVSEHANHIG